MASYRLYFLQAAELIGSDEIEAPDDVQAAAIARSRSCGRIVEVWRGSRKVRTLGPAGPASIHAS